MNKYFISRESTKFNHAGSKAVNDTDTIMENNGYERINIYPARSGNPILRKIRNRSSLMNLSKIKTDSIVIVEHPLYINPKYIYMLKNIKAKKNIRLFFIIHDFETERNLFPNDTNVREVEKIVLEICDGLIVHNAVMAECFSKKYNVDSKKLYLLNLFDYLCDLPKVDGLCKEGVTVAGNLNTAKSGYIYKAIKACTDVHFELYGVNFEADESQKNYTYYGSVNADELPARLSGKYGLVWDGPEIDSCIGVTGEYMRINNPHKASLYVASRLPLIVWSESAIARFVTENKIGLTVSSLSELGEKINSVSEAEYEEFTKNLDVIADKARSGGFFKAVLDQIEASI